MRATAQLVLAFSTPVKRPGRITILPRTCRGRDCPLPLEWNKYRHAGGHLQVRPRGKPIGIYNASGANHLPDSRQCAAYNPFRYRGYRYADTGFYYLQSRYYDPAICRFINADRYTDTGEKLVGYNMFVYCNNNSIVYTDFSGERAMGPSFYLVNDGGTPRINPFYFLFRRGHLRC